MNVLAGGMTPGERSHAQVPVLRPSELAGDRRCEVAGPGSSRAMDPHRIGIASRRARGPRFAGHEDDIEGRVRSLLAEGRKIEAIKVYRVATGAGLKEAKDAVEALDSRGVLPYLHGGGKEMEVEILSLLGRGEKFPAIKLYRERTGVGMKEAKDAVEVLAQRHGLAPEGDRVCGLVPSWSWAVGLPDQKKMDISHRPSLSALAWSLRLWVSLRIPLDHFGYTVFQGPVVYRQWRESPTLHPPICVLFPLVGVHELLADGMLEDVGKLVGDQIPDERIREGEDDRQPEVEPVPSPRASRTVSPETPTSADRLAGSISCRPLPAGPVVQECDLPNDVGIGPFKAEDSPMTKDRTTSPQRDFRHVSRKRRTNRRSLPWGANRLTPCRGSSLTILSFCIFKSIPTSTSCEGPACRSQVDRPARLVPGAHEHRGRSQGDAVRGLPRLTHRDSNEIRPVGAKAATGRSRWPVEFGGGSYAGCECRRAALSVIGPALLPRPVDSRTLASTPSEGEEERALLETAPPRRCEELLDPRTPAELQGGEVDAAVPRDGRVDERAVRAADPGVLHGRPAVEAGDPLDVRGVGVVVQLLHDGSGVEVALLRCRPDCPPDPDRFCHVHGLDLGHGLPAKEESTFLLREVLGAPLLAGSGRGN